MPSAKTENRFTSSKTCELPTPRSSSPVSEPERASIPDHRASLKGQNTLLAFEADFRSYHHEFVRAGIRNYFDGGQRSLSYVEFGVNGLLELFDQPVFERLMVIGFLVSEESRSFFTQRGVPFLNLVEVDYEPELGFDVQFEDEGTIAARHFIEEMKLNHIGFVGYQPAVSHDRRFREFEREAQRHRIPVSSLRMPVAKHQQRFCEVPEGNISHKRKAIREFLTRIEKPAGIFCVEDLTALQVYYAAELLGFRVPEDVAILGVGSRDNSKPLWARAVSVVQIDHYRLGYAAAKLMDAYHSTGKAPRSVRLAPSGICHSQTTFNRNVSDPVVRKALVLIQQDPSLDATRICEKLNLSRTTLDFHFKDSSNISLAKAIEIERFNHAMQLVKNKKYSLDAIASLAGYPNSRAMRRSFRRFTHTTPQQFREIAGLRQKADN